MAKTTNLRDTQNALREEYTRDPGSATVVLTVHSAESDLDDPLHCAVAPGREVVWRSGAHAAVGGVGDAPCSGDVLLGALAACQEITLRMVAANMGIRITSLTVTVEGDWDPRGTLAMRDFPIGLTRIRCKTEVTVEDDGKGDRSERLLRSAEKYCVVLNTLREGVPVDATFELRTS